MLAQRSSRLLSAETGLEFDFTNPQELTVTPMPVAPIDEALKHLRTICLVTTPGVESMEERVVGADELPTHIGWRIDHEGTATVDALSVLCEAARTSDQSRFRSNPLYPVAHGGYKSSLHLDKPNTRCTTLLHVITAGQSGVVGVDIVEHPLLYNDDMRRLMPQHFLNALHRQRRNMCFVTSPVAAALKWEIQLLEEGFTALQIDPDSLASPKKHTASLHDGDTVVFNDTKLHQVRFSKGRETVSHF